MINKRILFLALFLVTAFSGCQIGPLTDQVCSQQRCYKVEVVFTAPDRMRGLQGRKKLGRYQGMLFVFPKRGKHAFWMKDTLIPLDIIWMDGTRRIVHIEENVQPCETDPCPSYVPLRPGRFVLELNAFQARKAGMKKGEQLEFRLNKTNKK